MQKPEKKKSAFEGISHCGDVRILCLTLIRKDRLNKAFSKFVGQESVA